MVVPVEAHLLPVLAQRIRVSLEDKGPPTVVAVVVVREKPETPTAVSTVAMAFRLRLLDQRFPEVEVVREAAISHQSVLPAMEAAVLPVEALVRPTREEAVPVVLVA